MPRWTDEDVYQHANNSAILRWFEDAEYTRAYATDDQLGSGSGSGIGSGAGGDDAGE